MANIYFKCEHCQKSLAVDQAGAGKTVKCTDCKQPIHIPLQEIKWKCVSCGDEMMAPGTMGGQEVQCVECGASNIIENLFEESNDIIDPNALDRTYRPIIKHSEGNTLDNDSLKVITCNNCSIRMVMQSRTGVSKCLICNSDNISSPEALGNIQDLLGNIKSLFYEQLISQAQVKINIIDYVKKDPSGDPKIQNASFNILTVYFPSWHYDLKLDCHWEGENYEYKKETKWRKVNKGTGQRWDTLSKSYQDVYEDVPEPYEDTVAIPRGTTGERRLEFEFSRQSVDLPDDVNKLVYDDNLSKQPVNLPSLSNTVIIIPKSSADECIKHPTAQERIFSILKDMCHDACDSINKISYGNVSYGDLSLLYSPLAYVTYSIGSQQYHNIVSYFKKEIIGGYPLIYAKMVKEVDPIWRAIKRNQKYGRIIELIKYVYIINIIVGLGVWSFIFAGFKEKNLFGIVFIIFATFMSCLPSFVIHGILKVLCQDVNELSFLKQREDFFIRYYKSNDEIKKVVDLKWRTRVAEGQQILTNMMIGKDDIYKKNQQKQYEDIMLLHSIAEAFWEKECSLK